MKMYTKENISNHCMYDYFEKGFVYIVGAKQQPHDQSILASWNYVLLYTDGYGCNTRTHYPESEPTSLCSFFSVNAACLAEKQQMPNLGYFHAYNRNQDVEIILSYLR
jgi:hypothetical protein